MTAYPRVGDKFGAFVITGEIGHGGMGVVFSAQQQPLNRRVALKVLDPRFSNDPSFVTRFAHEGDLLAQLNSPHVIQIFDHGQIGDCLYLAMQHVAGGDLADYLSQHGSLAPALAADLTAQVASALADTHKLGIIHRDIKPSNVLLARTGSDLFAYLCDFGIAQGDQSGLTQTGMLVGSLDYTAPERFEGRPADVRSDLYSIGCLLWALVSGRSPYSGTDYQIAQQHLTAPVPQLAGSGPVEVAVNQVLVRLLAKDPNQRPASAVEVVAALRRLQRLAESLPRPAWGATVANPQPGLQQPVPGRLEDATTVSPSAQPRASKVVPVAAPVPPRPSKGSGGVKTAIVAVAIVGVAALVGGGSLWALTTLFSASPPVSTGGSASPGETSKAEPADTAKSTDSPGADPVRGPAQRLVDQIDVAEGPHGIAVNPGSRLAFVANYRDSSVSVINIDSNTVVRKIQVGAEPQSVAVDPATGVLLVGCDGIPAVQLYDLQRYSLVGSVSTGEGPIRLAVHSSQKVAYAVAQGSSRMEVISLESYRLIRNVDVGSKPRVIAVDERDQIAYIGHWDSRLLSVIDLAAQSKIAELRVGRNPNTVTIAPESRLAFVGNYGYGKDGEGSVSVVDLDKRAIKKTIAVDDGPSRVAVDEDANAAYLSCLYAAKVDVIDLTTLSVADRFSTGSKPTGVSVDSSTGRLYVTSFDEHVVQIFEP